MKNIQKLSTYTTKKCFIFFFCLYKMVLKITKETRGKCGIKTVKYYHEKEDIIESWQKMSDVQTQTKHSNIANVALKRIRKIMAKKQKTLKKKKNKNTKHILKVKKVFLLLKNLHGI